MKKFFSVFLFLAVSAVFATQWAPSRNSTDNPYQNGGIDTAISSSTAFDTLVNADSSTLFTGHTIESYWEYVLSIGPLGGTSAATCSLDVVIDGLDASSNQLTRYYVDTIYGPIQSNIQCVLPFYTAVYGHKFRVKVISRSGAQTILNRIYLYKRRPVTVNKSWF